MMFMQSGMYSFVLIESDWNLKDAAGTQQKPAPSINRIRLEFKSHVSLKGIVLSCRINRIRLEFKRRPNLRRVTGRPSINRIRLEFKIASRNFASDPEAPY